MKPTAEDLRVAREVINLWLPDIDPDSPIFGEKVLLRDRIASMRASEREKAAKVAEAHDDNHRREYMHCGLAIAEKIRRSKGETEGAAV